MHVVVMGINIMYCTCCVCVWGGGGGSCSRPLGHKGLKAS